MVEASKDFRRRLFPEICVFAHTFYFLLFSELQDRKNRIKLQAIHDFLFNRVN